MHDDELDTDVPLVRRLVAAQFPRWAHLPIERVASAGTDNALYRLGTDLVARLPRIQWAGEKRRPGAGVASSPRPSAPGGHSRPAWQGGAQ
jgi:aminoglycoside phosphotransferase (APT) family kinase protein